MTGAAAALDCGEDTVFCSRRMSAANAEILSSTSATRDSSICWGLGFGRPNSRVTAVRAMSETLEEPCEAHRLRNSSYWSSVSRKLTILVLCSIGIVIVAEKGRASPPSVPDRLGTEAAWKLPSRLAWNGRGWVTVRTAAGSMSPEAVVGWDE